MNCTIIAKKYDNLIFPQHFMQGCCCAADRYPIEAEGLKKCIFFFDHAVPNNNVDSELS